MITWNAAHSLPHSAPLHSVYRNVLANHLVCRSTGHVLSLHPRPLGVIRFGRKWLRLSNKQTWVLLLIVCILGLHLHAAPQGKGSSSFTFSGKRRRLKWRRNRYGRRRERSSGAAYTRPRPWRPRRGDNHYYSSGGISGSFLVQHGLRCKPYLSRQEVNDAQALSPTNSLAETGSRKGSARQNPIRNYLIVFGSLVLAYMWQSSGGPCHHGLSPDASIWPRAHGCNHDVMNGIRIGEAKCSGLSASSMI